MILLNDLHYLPMPRIILPLCIILPHIILPPIILPPGNHLMIYAIYPCPVSFCPPGSILPPYHSPPWKSLNVHYLPMSHIILPPPPHYHFAPWKLFHDLHYLSISRIILPPGFIFPHIILPPGNGLMINTISHVPYHFATALDFVFIQIKSLYNKSLWQARIRWLWHLWLILLYCIKVFRFIFDNILKWIHLCVSMFVS